MKLNADLLFCLSKGASIKMQKYLVGDMHIVAKTIMLSKIWITHLVIEQKGMTFDHNFCHSFSFSSSLFFRREEKRGKE